MTTPINNSSSGNLDIPAIVSALTAANDVKIQAIQKQQSSLQVQISTLGKQQSSIQTLSDSIGALKSVNTQTDTQANLQTKLQAFVTNYNSSKSAIKDSNQYQVKMGLTKFRAELGTFDYTQLGISFDKNGIASFNPTKFNTNFTSDPTGTTSMINQIGNINTVNPEIFNNILSASTGAINLQSQSLQKKITSLNTQIDKITRTKEVQTKQFTTQYTQLQNILNAINGTQNALTQFSAQA